MAIIFEVGFRTNGDDLTKALGPQLSTISKEISAAFNVPIGKGMTTELTKAINAAQTLETALKRATTDKGISFISLQQELRKAGTSAESIVATLASAGPQFSGSFNIALQSLSQANRQVIQISSKIKEMQRVMTQSIKFTAAQEIQRSFMTAISSAIGWVKDLNQEVTNIAVVTNKSGKSLEAVYQTIINGSKELRVAASDYAEGALIYYQQGLSDDEVKKRTEITIQAAKAAGSSVEAMSKQLTAIWNTYKMVGDEQQRAASVGAVLAANTAVDFADIAEAMQTSAAAAEQMGVSYNSLAAIIATVGDATQQSASVIGNAYKTIFSRFQQLTTTGTDGEVTLNSVSSKLQNLGVNVLDATGKLRELDDVILEVGEGWNKYTQEQQLAIAQLVGGTRQYGQFLSLMNNFDKYKANLSLANNEDGSALEKQYSQAQKTIETAAINAKEAWSRAFSQVFQDDNMIKFYNALEKAGEQVEHIIDGLGGLPGILTLAATILSRKLVPTLSQGGAMVKDFVTNLTESGRQKNIANEAQAIKTQTQQGFALQRNGASDRQKIQLGFQEQGANLKLDQYEKVATAMSSVNKMLNSNSEQLRTQGKYLQEQIQKYQSMYNQNVDLLTETKARAQLEKEAAEAIMKQNDGSKATGDSARKIESNNSEISALREQNAAAQAEINRLESEISANSHATDANQFMSEQERGEVVKQLERQKEIQDQIINGNNQQIQQLEQENAAQFALSKATQERREAQAGIQKIVSELKLKVAELAEEQDGVFDSKDAKDYFEKLKAYFKKLNIDIQDVGDELEQAFDQLSTGGDGQKSEMSQGLERIKEILDEISEDDELDLEVNTEGLDEVGEQVENARSGLHNLEEVIGQANNKMVGLQLSFTDIASSMVSLGTNSIYLATSFSNMANSLKEGDLTGFAAGLTALSFQIPSIIKSLETLKSAYVALNTVKALSAQISAAQTKEITLETAAKAAGVTITDGMTAAQVKEAFAAKGLTIALADENAEITANSGVVGVNAAVWWSHPVVLIIVGVIMAAVAVIGIWSAAIKHNTEMAQKNVDKHKENLETIEKTTQAVEDNTRAVKDNVDAYRQALTNGENITEVYGNLSDSLNELNKSLIEAGASQEALNQAMSNALATGDMTDYYNLTREASAALFNQKMDEYEALNVAQVKLAKAEMTKVLDFDGPEKTKIAETRTYYNQGDTIQIEPSKALKDIAQDSDLFTSKNGTITLDLKFDNAADFRKQYDDLVKIRGELEKQGAKVSELSAIDEQIEGMTENYDLLTEQVKEATAAMESMFMESVKWQTSEDGGGLNLEGMDFNTQGEYLSQIYEQIAAYGERIGMTNEEIEQSFRSVASSIPELNTTLASMDQVKQISTNIFNNNPENDKAITEYMDRIKKLQKMQEEAATKTGIGEWFNGLSAEEEYWRDMGISAEDAAKEIADAQKKLEEFAETQAKIQNKFNSLSGDERDILLKAGVEFIDDEDDIQQTLDAFNDLSLKVNLKIKNKDQLEQEINDDNKLQDGLSTAIGEFQKTGMISVDTAKAMIDSGLAEYLMVVDDHFVLTTGAANAYNGSLEREKDNVQKLLELQTELRAPTQEFAESMAALTATIDNADLETFISGLEDVGVQFLNSEGSAQDMIHYFEELARVNTEATNIINQNLNNLSTDQIRQMYSEMEALGNNLASTMQQANNAFAAGQMTMSEYREALAAAGQAQAASAKNALELSKAQIRSAYSALQSAKAEGASEERLESLQKDLQKARDQYNKTQKSVDNFNKKLSDFKAFDAFTSAIEQNKEVLEGFLNDDFTLAFDIEELDQTQLDALTSAIEGTFETISQLSEEGTQEFLNNITSMIGDAEGQLTQAEANMVASLVTQIQNHEITAAEGLQQIQSQAGENASTITQAFLTATATQNEGQITSTSQAIGSILDAVGEAITNFDAEINVVPSGKVSIVPTWGNMLDLGWKLITGQKVTAGVEGDMNFAVTGSSNSLGGVANALSNAANFFNTNTGGGKVDGTPSLGDYNPKTPTAADPTDFEIPEGTGSDKKGGGNGKDYKNDAKAKDVDKPEYRYEDIDSSIQSLTTTIEKLNDAEEDAWGKTKIRNLKALNFEISKQNTLLTSRLKEAKAYYDFDWANVINSSAINSAGFNASNITRNNDGSISNIEEIKTALWETYVKPYIEAENNLIGSTNEEAVKAAQAATEAANKIYEDALGLLEKLDDSVQQYKDTLQKIVDNIRSMMSNIASEINSRLEFRIGIRERDLKRLEKLADRWGDLGVLNGETDKSLQRQWPKILQKMDNTVAEMEYTFAHIDMLEAAKEKGKDSDEYQQIVKYMTKDMSEEQAKLFNKAFDEYLAGNAALPAEFADMLMDMRDNLEEYFNDAVDNQLQQLDNIFTRVNDWLDKTFAEWDRVLDFNDSILNWSDALLEYTGAYSANDLSMQESVRLQNTAKMQNAQGRLDSNIAKYNSYKEAIDSATGALDYIKKNLGNAVKMTAEEWADEAARLEEQGDMVGAAGARMFAEFGAGAESMMQAEIDEWRSAQQDLMAEIVDSQTELLNIAQENIEREKEMAKKNVGTILNGLFTDLEDMADNYDKVKAEKDMTFDDYDQTYMTNKLQNMYDEYIESADPAAIESMTKWQEKLNKYKEEMVTIDENGNEVITHRLNMSQNEYDLLLKEFELEQAKAEWEDARNNKNTMRLARDASGNYSYVYSSDATAEDTADNAQNLADKEYEYKKMLESIQDETIATTTQIGIELQNTIDGINQYLWEHDEKYRESVKTKISALYKQLQSYGDQSARIFDGLAIGVGEFGNVWDGSAGQILTGSTDMEGYIRDMATAICGPDGNMTTPDGSSYLGRILQAQEYWGTTANNALKESMQHMASGEDKDSIPSSFGDIGDRVLSVIEEKIGNPDLASSAYGKFKSNTETLQTQIDNLLVGDQSSVWQSYKTLGTHTEEELGAIGNAHNDILFSKIKEYIGTPDEDSDTTVLGRIKKLKDDMVSLRNSTGTELKTITGQFQTWATEVIPKIQSVIDKIQEAIGKADELQNSSEPEDPDSGKPFTHPEDIGDVGQTIDPGIGVPTTPSTPSTPSAPAGPKPFEQEFSHAELANIVKEIAVYGKWKNGGARKQLLEQSYPGKSAMLQQAVNVALGYPPGGGKIIDQAANYAYQHGSYKGTSWDYYKDKAVQQIFGYETGGLATEHGMVEIAEKGPELVLNKEDTENILKAVSLMRQTVAAQFGSINGSLAGVTNSITHQAAPPVASTQSVDQQVHIEASFPGVSVAQEIEDALNSLITQAAQYNIKR